MREFDAIVLGGGAAGLFCAFEAGRRGKRVLVIERNAEVGRKILISGGGRCNFTNLYCGPEHFLSANPHFTKSALARFNPKDFVSLVRAHGIAYHAKKDGQLFCDGSARQIVELLVGECRAAGARIATNCAVEHIEHGERFRVVTNSGEFQCRSLVVATGGLSIPKLGATDLGHRLASQFGLKLQPCRPALVPLILGGGERKRIEGIAGVALEVTASCRGEAFREKLLITHRGLSGPAILQISSYWRPGAELEIDLLPGRSFHRELGAMRSSAPRLTPLGVAADLMPRRLAQRLLGDAESARPLAELSNELIEQITGRIHHWKVHPAATEGYEKAEVTAGGVDTADLSSKTMACSKVPGLYFIGEVVDVTGHLGGHNFQWAWSSAHSAGCAI